MAYQVFFGSVMLPIPPSNLELKINNQNRLVTLINEGEINLLKSPGLTDVSFTVLLPAVKYPFAADTGYNTQAYLQLLEELKVNKKPFQFIVYREKANGDVLYKTNLKVALEDYTLREDAELLGFDVEAFINLKQYKEYGTKVLTVKNTGEGDIAVLSQKRSDGTGATNIEKEYKVKQGDTLWLISKRKLGKGERWKEIYQLNQTDLESDAKKRGYQGSAEGNLIFPGIVLTLPRR